MKINSDMTFVLIAMVILGLLYLFSKQDQLLPLIGGALGSLCTIATSDARSKNGGGGAASGVGADEKAEPSRTAGGIAAMGFTGKLVEKGRFVARFAVFAVLAICATAATAQERTGVKWVGDAAAQPQEVKARATERPSLSAHQAVRPLRAAKPQDGRAIYLPDSKMTPGATLSVSEKDVCVKGYAGQTRNVPESEKKKVYQEYGITSHKPGEYEIDHLISLELGGSNDIKNLWPEPYDLNVDGYQKGAHEKDKVEDKLHQLVCAGTITLDEARSLISSDWTVAYRKYISPEFPKYEVAEDWARWNRQLAELLAWRRRRTRLERTFWTTAIVSQLHVGFFP